MLEIRPPPKPATSRCHADAAALPLARAVAPWVILLWAALPSAFAAPAQPGVVSVAQSGTPSSASAQQGGVSATLGSVASAQSDAGRTNGRPAHARVGLLLLSISNVNVAAASYMMDMYLTFACDRPCDLGDFELMNGRPLVEDLQEKTPTGRMYRVLAELRGAWDLHAYPFDSNDLAVAIENKVLGSDKLVYIADGSRTAIDRRATVAGWDFPRRWTATVRNHPYPVLDRTFSHYEFTTTLQRPILVGVLTLAPAAILVSVGLLALGLRADLGTQRLTVSTSALVAMVLFHVSVRAGLPPVGYFTFADRFVIISYVALAVIIVLAMMILNRLHAGDAAGAEHVRRVACWAVPTVWAGLEAITIAAMLAERGG